MHQQIQLDKRISHHLSIVLRCQVGDQCLLFNGDGHDYAARLVSVGKRATAQIDHAVSVHTESPVYTRLWQAISRGDRMDATIQKAVELGVSEVLPIYTTHAIKRLDAKREQRKLEHWQAIVISACEQSRRSTVPDVQVPTSLTEALAQPSEATLQLALSPTAEHALTQQLRRASPRPTCIDVLIGPESGLDADEVSRAVKAGFVACHLGERVLRTETAGPAVLAMIQALVGDLASC